MNDYIKKLYESLEYFNIEQFDEIYDEIKSGNIKTHVEDIVHCANDDSSTKRCTSTGYIFNKSAWVRS